MWFTNNKRKFGLKTIGSRLDFCCSGPNFLGVLSSGKELHFLGTSFRVEYLTISLNTLCCVLSGSDKLHSGCSVGEGAISLEHVA